MTKQLSKYSIKDLEVLSGIKAHTLRIWELRYNLLSPKRTDTNIRYYDDDDVKKILNISLLNQNGIKISKLSQLSSNEISDKVISLTDQNLKFPEQVHSLVLSMLNLDEFQFVKVMDRNVDQHGFEKCMFNIIYPFLVKIGFLWQTGAISPGHEHFITNLIRQKTIYEIHKLQNSASGKKFMLFLPEDEYHELSLLFAQYILKLQNQNVLYLGQNLPLIDAEVAFESFQPDYIFTVLTMINPDFEISEYLEHLSNTFKNTQILVTGFQVVNCKLKLNKNIKVLTKLEDIQIYK